MRIPERIEYLNKFRQPGDLKAIADHYQLNMSTVAEIVKGKYVGKHGEKVLSMLEEIIEKRAVIEKVLADKYRKKLNGTL